MEPEEPMEVEGDGPPSTCADARPDVIFDEMPIEKLYEYYSCASDLAEILRSFEALKRNLGLTTLHGLDLFRGLKLRLSTQRTWKARDVLAMLDKRADQKEFMGQKAAKGVRVLIVGAGPVGMRMAIDCMLLGCDVVVVEKRKTFSRNNVLHLWPFTIEDLKQLGAKKFYGKFCAGAIDHISIRSLQCLLLKICLMLGIPIHHGLEFVDIQEPTDSSGWRADFNPSDHPVNSFEFDVLVGADGRRSVLPGFDRKELRGKLALAITANFINYFTSDEVAVEEISGVAFIFNQKFFKDLKEDTGIDLENIVYYKDDVHYFVMTAKKDSLLHKGVFKKDLPDTRALLHPDNINYECLYDYSIEAADWSTALPRLDFAVNHYRLPDVALFDFTSIHQAEYSARAVCRRGKNLITCLVGDALLEPFWPTGTGLARGFLSAMDTAWMIRGLGQRRRVLELLSEREIIFKRLPQTTPENLQSSIRSYTINPQSRYCSLYLNRVNPENALHLYDVDEDGPAPLRHGSFKRTASEEDETLKENIPEAKKVKDSPLHSSTSSPLHTSTASTASPLHSSTYSPVTSPSRKPLTEKGSVTLAYYSEAGDESSLRDPTVLLKWLQGEVKGYGIKVTNLSTSWRDGMALCALIYRYHPELIPHFHQLSPQDSVANNTLAFSVAEEHFGINSLLKPTEMMRPDKLTLLTYLSLFYELFINADPASSPSPSPPPTPTAQERVQKETKTGKGEAEKSVAKADKKAAKRAEVEAAKDDKVTPKKKRRSILKRKASKGAKLLATSPESTERSWNTKSVRRIFSPPTSPVTQAPPTGPASQAPPTGRSDTKPPISSGATPKTPSGRPQSRFGPTNDSSDFCFFCTKRVYLMERMSANGFFFHRTCFRCSHCGCQLKIGGYSLSKGVGGEKGKFFCNAHYRQLFLSNPEAINYSRAGVPKRQTSSEEVSGPKAKPLTSITISKVPEVIENGTTSPQSMDSSSFTTPPSTPSTPPPEKHSKRSKGSRFFSRKGKGKSKKSKSASPEPVEEEGGKERASSAEPELTVEVEESAPELKSFVRLRTSQSGNVQRLSRGFENLEAEARADEEINPFDRVSSVRSRAPTSLTTVSEAQPSPAAGPPPTSTIPSLQVLQKALTPVSGKWYQFGIHLGIKSPELHRVEKKCLGRPEDQFLEELLVLWLEKGVPAPSWRVVVAALKKVEETGLAAQLERKHGLSQRQWTGRGVRAHQIEDTLHIPRSSNLRPERRRRGQQSAVRSFGSAYSTSDVAMQDRQRQQQRFREAQLNQREMSQLERQYEELEEYGRQIEETLRDTESTSQEDQFMKKWLNLVNERNGLVRKTAELSLKMKELALEDQQYEIEKELNCLFGHPDLSEEEQQHFEDLLEQKIQVVNERDALVIQTDEERKREIEEDETRGLMMDEQFGLGRTSSQSSLTPEGSPSLALRRPSQPEAYVESILRKDLEHKKRRARSWWGTK